MSTTGVYTDLSGLADLRLQAKATPDAAAKEVAHQFESLFVSMMLKAMRDTLPKDGLFGSNQMETYQSMFDNQLAMDMSKGGGIGLADIIEQQIANTTAYKAQEIADLAD